MSEWLNINYRFSGSMFQNMSGNFMSGFFSSYPGNTTPSFGFRNIFSMDMFSSQNLSAQRPVLNMSMQTSVSSFGISSPKLKSFDSGWGNTFSFSSKTRTPLFQNKSTALRTKKHSSVCANEHKYDNLINKYAAKYNLEPEFVRAVIKQESRFNPNAVSHAGAKGLMQLMPATAKSYGVTNAYNPEQNIEAGVHMLSKLTKQYNGNKEMVLAAYNWGSGNLAKKGFDKRPKETREYITFVMQYYNEYKSA